MTGQESVIQDALRGANEPQVGRSSCQLLGLWMSGDKSVKTVGSNLNSSFERLGHIFPPSLPTPPPQTMFILLFLRPEFYGLGYPRQLSPRGNFIERLYVKTSARLFKTLIE